MLVLTRKVGDVIAIGDNIKIVVMAIKGKQVRLGIQADRNTIVHREEVYQKIQKEIHAAMQSDVSHATAADALLKNTTESQNAANPERIIQTASGSRCVIRKRPGKEIPENEFEDEEDSDE